MNILLWILQIMLALHTVTGAIWKFSNSGTVESLQAIPHGVWTLLSIIEFFCALGFILPLIFKRLGRLAPIAAVCIAAEMLLFIVLSIFSDATNCGEIIYWLVVGLICGFIAYGRFVLKPV